MWTPLSVATQTPSGVPDLLPFWQSNLHKLWDQIRSHVWLGLGTRCGACLGRSGYFRVPDLTIFWAFRCAKSGSPSGHTRSGNFFHIFCQFLGPDLGPYLDPKNGYQKWSPIKNIRESKFWTPKTEPNLDPKTGPPNSYFWSTIIPKNGQKMGPKNESKAGSQNWGPKMGPKKRSPRLSPKLDPTVESSGSQNCSKNWVQNLSLTADTNLRLPFSMSKEQSCKEENVCKSTESAKSLSEAKHSSRDSWRERMPSRADCEN